MWEMCVRLWGTVLCLLGRHRWVRYGFVYGSWVACEACGKHRK